MLTYSLGGGGGLGPVLLHLVSIGGVVGLAQLVLLEGTGPLLSRVHFLNLSKNIIIIYLYLIS